MGRAFILHPSAFVLRALERETGFEPATSTLARSHSTTELLPLAERKFYGLDALCQAGTTGAARIRLQPPPPLRPSPTCSFEELLWHHRVSSLFFTASGHG